VETNFDVVIIGGGPSGSSAATYLSQLGYKVVVLEKEKFPREHVGESLIPFCYYRLKDLGVLEKIQSFATKKPGINFISKDGKKESVWCFERVLTDGAGMIFHTPRDIFDKTLLDHSASVGATVLEQHAVKNVSLENPEEVIVRATDINGEEKTFKGKFLLDASGQHSFLAKKFGDKNSYDGLDRTAFYRRWRNNNYDKALNAGLIKIVYLGGEKKGWIWVIPIGRNYLSIGISLNNDYVREKKKTLSGDNWKNDFYESELAEATCLDEILRGAIPEHDTLSVGDYSYFVKKKYGENWAMIGDAGAFLDPIFSSGLFAAMETAHRIVKALDIKFKQGADAGRKAFEETSVDIEGGYKLIEKFVRLFYDPETLNFSHVTPDETGFAKFLTAYNIFHYLLAGDFFSNHVKYSAFIDTLNKEKNYNQFLNFAKNRTTPLPDSSYCNYTFEEIYGHLPEEDIVAPIIPSEKKLAVD
jgi:flavin-dependent dehydrogenase